MNYDNQKPLTQKEINYINSKKGISLMHISHYSNNNIHVEIAWALPIKITRNEDSFWWDNYKESNKENYWVVYPDSDSEYTFQIPIKQFENIDDALSYGKQWYKNWLHSRLEYLNEIV
jgi:hypothetical protein